ncbi:MAG: hypoxanthine phosphoribosyltransferase, partial [Gemmatimonadales bacterium]|nr:hypoxanthine phosphoribosyltransferase [Gemmatimonadales bacterium]
MPTLTEDTQLGGQKLSRIVFSAEEIASRVTELGQEISETYSASDRLLVLGLLKGSVLFMSDLVRAIHLPLHVDFMVASSYGREKVSSGDVRLLYDARASLKGRAVVLVEDIMDGGATLSRL